MRIAQIFWKEGKIGTELARNTSLKLVEDSRQWVRPTCSEEALLLNFMFVETPNLSGVPIPCVNTIVIPDGKRQWRPVLYEFYDVPPIHTIYDPAPRCLEILLKVTADLYAQIIKNPENAGRALSCFIKFEDIAVSLTPKDFRRIHFEIASRWAHWEQTNLSWAERAADLETGGITLNHQNAIKNVDALEK